MIDINSNWYTAAGVSIDFIKLRINKLPEILATWAQKILSELVGVKKTTINTTVIAKIKVL